MSLFTTRRSNAIDTCLKGLLIVLMGCMMACNHEDPTVSPTSFALTTHEMTLAFPDSLRMSYRMTPSDATTSIEWKSSNPTVLSVDKRGYIRTLSIGHSVITATCGNLSDTCSITVKPYLETIRFTGAAMACTPDTLYYGGKIYNAKMNGEDVKVYKALLTLYVLSEGLYCDADGLLTGAARGAVITVKAPMYYGPASLNKGKSVGNIVDRYDLVDPYADDIHTFAIGSLDDEKYVAAMAERLRHQNAPNQAKQWADSAAHCVHGTTLSMVNLKEDGTYEITTLPTALVEEGCFTLTNNGITAMTYGLKNSHFVVRPFISDSEYGVIIGSDGSSLADNEVHYGEEITYTY